jgi:hypothetical protein
LVTAASGRFLLAVRVPSSLGLALTIRCCGAAGKEALLKPAKRWQNGDASASVEAASASVAMAAKAKTDVRRVNIGASVLLVNDDCHYPKNASLLTM